jgi:Flp pilus assembly protein CpaB
VPPRHHRWRTRLIWRLRRSPLLWWSAAAVLTLATVAAAQQATTPPSCPARSALAGRGPSAVAAALPEGTRAVAVPVSGALPVQAGDHVDVIAAGDPLVEGPFVEGEVAGVTAVAETALVVDVADEAVTVAVPEADAPSVAWQATQGTTTLVLVGR